MTRRNGSTKRANKIPATMVGREEAQQNRSHLNYPLMTLRIALKYKQLPDRV